MARRIEHRSTSEWPAARVYAALIDIDYLKQRLAELGGSNTELVEHSETGDGVRFQIRQGVRAEHLPSVARSVVGGDLVIDRSESWRQEEPGHYTGEVAAAIPRVPGSITGSMWLRDVVANSSNLGSGPRSEFVVEGGVRVNVPFVAGKLEDLVADQVHKLLTEEARFTTDWLARNS